MFARLREFVVKQQIRFYKVLSNIPRFYDFALCAALIPACTLTAYFMHSEKLPYRDYNCDRIMKRNAYFPKDENINVSKLLLKYKGLSENILRLEISKVTPKDLQELSKIISFLSGIQQEMTLTNYISNLNQEFLNSLFRILLDFKPKIAKSTPSLILLFHMFEESAAYLLLKISINPNLKHLYEQNKDKIDEIMQKWKDEDNAKNVHSLKTALAESYFYNLTNSAKTGIIYDGQIMPMNPQKMSEFDTDIIFICGQQSHCFNTWRILKNEGAFTNPVMRRTYQVSSLWPPKFIPEKYNARLLALNYSVFSYYKNKRHHAIVLEILRLE